MDSCRTHKGLDIVVESGWLHFCAIRQLERTCSLLCCKCRDSVARKILVTNETPRGLWCRSRRPVPAAAKSAARACTDNEAPSGATSSSGARERPMGSLAESRDGAAAVVAAAAAGPGDARGSTNSGSARRLEGNAKRGALGSLLLLREYGDDAEDDEQAELIQHDVESSPVLEKGASDSIPNNASLQTAELLRGPACVLVRRTRSPLSHSGEGAARIPAVRVSSIDWKLPVAELLSPGFQWPEGVKRLSFWAKFNESLRGVPLPESLEHLSFGFRFNQSLARGHIEWPRGLKTLELRGKWNQRLLGAKDTWPPSLITLRLGSTYTRGLTGDGVGFPPGLRELSLGGLFNETLVGVEWPRGLQRLVLSENFDQSLAGVSFPPSLRELWFGRCFSGDLAGASFPNSLEVLALGELFVSRLQEGSDGRTFLPQGLIHLRLGDCYSGRVGRHTLPPRLRSLYCGKCTFAADMVWPSALRVLSGARFFSGSAVRLPKNLEVMETSSSFRQSLDHFVFPATLRVLRLGDSFKHALDAARFPDGLQELCLGSSFNQDMTRVRLPRGLRRLVFSKDSAFDQEVAAIDWPPGLEQLHLGNCFSQPLEGTTLPPGLRSLYFGHSFSYSLQALELPHTLETLHLPARYPRQHVQGLDWPSRMRALTVGAKVLYSRREMVEWAVAPAFCP